AGVLRRRAAHRRARLRIPQRDGPRRRPRAVRAQARRRPFLPEHERPGEHRMTGREHILVADDNATVTSALSVLLERPGRTTIVCSDVESAEIMLSRSPVTHVVTDVQFSGAFGYEGLHFL